PLVVLLGLSVPPARAAQTGQFVLRCPYSHSLPDDPIVFPGQPGVSHLHDFLGNTSTDAFSTYGSMTLSSATTTCPPTTGDTSGYWIMALFKNGVQVEPSDPKYPPHGAQ